MRTPPLDDSLARDEPLPSATGDVSFATITALAFLAVALPRILHHVMWRDEWRAWLLVRDSAAFGGLRAATRFDGHPPLWFLTLKPLTWLTHDPRAMQVMHVGIASTAVWHIARYAPWRRWQTIGVCLGYFVFFEYAILSRNYAWGELFLIGAFASFDRRSRGWLAFCLAGAIQSNAFAGMVAAAMLLAACVDDFRTTRVRRVDPRTHRWLLLPIASAIVAYIWMRPGPSAGYVSPYDFHAPLAHACGTLLGLWNALVPIPSMQTSWWNSALFSVDPSAAVYAPQLFYGLAGASLAVALVLVWQFRRHRAALITLSVSWTILFAFTFVRLDGAMRHHGHYVLALLGAWWLSKQRPIADELAATVRRRDALMSVIIGVQAVGGIVAGYRDVTQPFSAAAATADWVVAHDRDVRLIGITDYGCVPVAARLDRPFFAPESFAFVTVNSQSPAAVTSSPNNEGGIAAMLRAIGDDHMLLIRNSVAPMRLGQPIVFDATLPGGPPTDLITTPIAAFPDSAIESECYTIFDVRTRPR